MFHDSAMIRLNTLIKNIWVILLPSILSGILVFQVFKCGSVLNRRNSYLLENLPATTNWAWDAVSGRVFPDLYHHDDQPGGVLNSRSNPATAAENSKTALLHITNLKSEWQRNKQKYDADFRDLVLIPGLPSLTVHYLWCADAYFDISNYISVLSALHQFRPDKITIHYTEKPRIDLNGYWRWLEDLERDVVFLNLKPLKDSRLCSHQLSAGVGPDDFPDAHGIFILGDVGITNLTRTDISRMMVESFLGRPFDKLKDIHLDENMWKQSQIFVVSNSEPYHISKSPGRSVIACPSVTEFDNAKDLVDVSCVTMQSYFSSQQILHTNTRFFRYARTLLFGSPNPLPFQTDKNIQIPNIFHLILKDESNTITPLIYACIKSAFVTGKFSAIYVHGKEMPRGEIWERLIYSDKLSPIFVPTGSFIDSDKKNTPLTYLLYTLLQHGGLASFGDIIFVKPISLHSAASAVSSLHRSQYRQTHPTLNLAVLAAVPGSEFIQLLLGMVHQLDISWSEMNPEHLATHLSEVNTQDLFIDSQLVSHQDCDGGGCKVAGGHDPPQMVSTTRLIWKTGEPETLEQLANVEGPSKMEIQKLIIST